VAENGFTARGGWWVVAQFLLFVLAYFIPLWSRGQLSAVSSGPYTTIGAGLMIAGGLLFVIATVTLGRGMTPFPKPVESGRLRTRGIYALMRHPIYTGVLCMAAGWSLAHLSIAGLAFCLLLFLFFDRKAVREEKWLTAKYPDYPAYARQVRKLIPWVY